MTLEENINDVQSRKREQRLFPDIIFTCNGFITKWIVGGEHQSRDVYVHSELSVWRRIAFYTFIKISYSALTQGDMRYCNVYEYILDPPLEFQEGDVLGIFQPNNSNFRVYYQEDTGPLNYKAESINKPLFTLIVDRPNPRSYYPLVSVEIQSGIQACKLNVKFAFLQ